MKNSKLILIILMAMLVFVSCEKADDEPEQMNEETVGNIVGKWEVNNSTIYESFEFTNNGVCIMVENSAGKSVNGQTIKAGTYDLDDLGLGIILLFEMNDSRVLDNILLTPESASFTVTNPANPGNSVAVQSDRAEEMEGSERTELIAKSWIVVSTTIIDDEGVSQTFQLLENNIRMIFSMTYYGTFSSYSFQNGEEEQGFGNWMWTDNTETAMKTWLNDESFGDADLITIDNLTENSLIISALQTNGYTGIFNCIPEPSGLFW